ncbi:MAG: ubiquitin-conjugating enzyme E2 [Acidobacteriota bacterium]|nr:ubiquitin-conjugating enzyme E2 [Acidobacteriota bacterium]
MAISYRKMDDTGLVDELARLLECGRQARTVLYRLDYPEDRIPNTTNAGDFWHTVCREIDKGIIKRDLGELLTIVADIYPGNELMKEWRKPRSKQGERAGPSITIPGVEDVQATFLLAREVADEMAFEGLEAGFTNEGELCIYIIGDVEDGQARDLARAIGLRLGEQGRDGNVHTTPYRDYLISKIIVEGPDQGRFELTDIPSTTRTGDLGGAVMEEYDEDMVPTDGLGNARPFTVDRVAEEGNERLDPDKTLHENGIEDGDTLHVAPESTAGNLNPMIRKEALVRARLQIEGFAQSHKGFSIKANARQRPTKYLLSFSAPGWGPPGSNGKPYPVDNHKVEVILLDDFPMKAPVVIWRTPFFHPNVSMDSGGVCLGILSMAYRPALDLGELCQMILDLGGYRNYEIAHGLNDEARAWAFSLEGQKAIEERGGFCFFRKLMHQHQKPRRLKVRRL